MTSGQDDGRDWEQAVALLRGAGTITLACHVSPDGDALGSMLALGLGLERLGLRVSASHGTEPFRVPANLGFLPGQHLLVDPGSVAAAPELLVTFDTGSVDRLGGLADRVASATNVIVVDHHATNTRFGSVNLVDVAAASTTVLSLRLLDLLGAPLTPDIAACVYTGLVTDTGSFRYAATTPEVHEIAARLLATGIRHDEITRVLYDTHAFGYLRVLGAALASTRLEADTGLVWTVITRADRQAHGLGLDEVEAIIDVVRTAREAEVALVLKEDDAGELKASMRSKGAVDVGEICLALGGGGHRFAAGFTCQDPAPVVVEQLRAAIASAPRLQA